jgi:NADP-dependent 3-hydroxy acid dehydrogenase YdfG
LRRDVASQASFGLAQNGYEVIAGVQIWPQVTSLRQKVKSLGLSNLRVEKLDLLHPYDVANALKWDIDILFSNAGLGENGVPQDDDVYDQSERPELIFLSFMIALAEFARFP